MSRQGVLNFLVFVMLAAGVTAGWWYVEKTFFPPPPPKEPPPPPLVPPPVLPPDERELLLTGAGGLAAFVKTAPVPEDAFLAAAGPIAAGPAKLNPPKPKPVAPQSLIRLGTEQSHLQVLLNARGAGVQQVVLPRFEEATRLGVRATQNGKTVPLHLIPGVVRPRAVSMLDQPPFPELKPGVVADPSVLAEPSYLLTHYLPSTDPKNPEQYPVDDLATRTWEYDEKQSVQTADLSKVVFHTTLADPFFVRITKTFTLRPGDYHIGFDLTFEAVEGRPAGKDAPKLRYQLSGAHGLPIESEWSTGTYRAALVGWMGPSGTPRRTIEDALTIQMQHGGTQVRQEGNTFAYAATVNQFFASALAIDDTQDDATRKGLWQYARPTREPLPWATYEKNPFLHGIEDKAFLGDITVRVASNALDLQPGKPVSHSYLIYNGPVKVRLLNQLKADDGSPAVAPELVDRYLDKLTLRTLTDHHSPHFFGRVSNSLWISDVIIFFTNVMHDVLAWLHGLVPIWGVDILLLTVLVRLMLLIPSKKQQGMMAKMQDKMAKLKPEIDKLKEKYGSDYQTFNQERTRLMLRNGVNPLSSMGGCLLMFAQFPVFMGLYFCLQESVFFRLEPFLWIPNLAAPDMLVWWTEKIPFVSDPTSVGGTFYLGPYFNVLPIAAITLMFIQQQLTMPPPTDEQQAMNAKLMKFMMIFMGIFFYKMAAGMCLYFIVSTGWGLIERRFVKKAALAEPTESSDAPDPSTTSLTRSVSGAKAAPAPVPPPTPGGFFSRLKARIEEVQRQADQRQIRNDPTTPPPPQPPKGGGGGGKGGKKKKKR